MQTVGMVLVIALIVLFTGIIWHDMHHFAIRKYELNSVKLKHDLRICLLSDLHGKDYGHGNQALLAAIDQAGPELILVAGDMITFGQKDMRGYDNAVNFLAALSQKYPVYLGNGNHECKLEAYAENMGDYYSQYADRLEAAGVRILRNESVAVPDMNICITGLEMDPFYYRRVYKHKMTENYLADTIGHASKDIFQILIAHNPMYFEEYAAWGAELTVSGHVHGGIVKLPFIGGVISPALILFPKYDGGRYDTLGKTLILSRGLGTHSIPVRMFNPGEIVVIDLKKTSETV